MSVDDYKQQSTLVYNRMVESIRFCATAQSEYGKWLVNTLWLMHSGALVGLLFRSPGGRPEYLGSLWWFVIGIALAFGAGFAAWWNFTFATDLYSKWAKVSMLTNPADQPTEDPVQSLKIKITMWIAVVAGVLSLCCLLGGAAAVYCNWPSSPK